MYAILKKLLPKFTLIFIKYSYINVQLYLKIKSFVKLYKSSLHKINHFNPKQHDHTIQFLCRENQAHFKPIRTY